MQEVAILPFAGNWQLTTGNLFPRKGDRRDSNPRRPGPQPGALPTELRPPSELVLMPMLAAPVNRGHRRGRLSDHALPHPYIPSNKNRLPPLHASTHVPNTL